MYNNIYHRVAPLSPDAFQAAASSRVPHLHNTQLAKKLIMIIITRANDQSIISQAILYMALRH